MSLASSSYVELLTRNSDFRKLYIGQVVSLLGDWFNFVAVQTLVFNLTHSGVATGLAIVTSTLPSFFLTPLAGSIADRFDRRKIMIVADLARTLIALGMILVRTADQLPMLYLLMALLVVFGSFFNPASNAAIPNLVRKDQLLVANALSNATWGIVLAVGMLLGGVTVAALGNDVAFVINSMSFVISGALLLTIRTPFAERVGARVGRLNPFKDFAQGLAYAWSRPQTLLLLTVKAGGALAGGVVLLLTIFSFEVFKVGAIGIGLLQLARGAGILIGPLAVAPFVGGRINRAQQVIATGFFLAGVSYMTFGATPTILLGMIAVAFAHMGWGSNWTLSATLLQRLTPDQIRGRVFSMDMGLFTMTTSLSTFVTGVAADQYDPRTVAYILGSVFLVFGTLWTGAVVWSRRAHPERWVDGAIQEATEATVDPRERVFATGE